MIGIVLKEMPLGEADKLLKVFSREEGLITVVAKGAKKSGSRFLAAASVFAYSDMELVKGKSMYVLKNAKLIESFYGLREDLDILTAAADIGKMTLKVIQEDLPDEESLELLLKALALLEKKRDPLFVKAVFTIRLLWFQGMIGSPEEMTPDEMKRLLPGTLAAFKHICSCDEDKLFAFKLSEEALKDLCRYADSLHNIVLN